MATFSRPMRAILVVATALVLVVAPGAALAETELEPSCSTGHSAVLELAPWVAAGGGVRRLDGGTRAIGLLALDTGVTLPVEEYLRVGAWTAAGTVDFRSFDVSGGARLELLTSELDGTRSGLFGVTGRYALVLDGGLGTRLGDGPFFAARVSAGFVAPNRLYHLYQFDCACERAADQGPASCRPSRGLVSGARPFVALTRSFDGARTEVTFGIEFEAIGAGWWFGDVF